MSVIHVAEKHTIRFEIGDEITMIDTRKLLEVAIDKSLPFSQGVD